jgi:hypothetical protein
MIIKVLSLDDVEVDELLRTAARIDARALASTRLAEAAGMGVELEAHIWDGGETYTRWIVAVPPELGDDLLAMVWDYPDGEMEYTLTRSMRHPDAWQLTTWGTDGLPWGHTDIFGPTIAFDTGPMDSGVPLVGLRQIMFRDGRVMVRPGATRVVTNPEPRQNPCGLKRRLMR